MSEATQPQQTPAELKAVFDVIQRQIELDEVSALAANRIWEAAKKAWNTRAHLPEKPSELVEWILENKEKVMGMRHLIGRDIFQFREFAHVNFPFNIAEKLRAAKQAFPTTDDWLRAVAAALREEGK